MLFQEKKSLYLKIDIGSSAAKVLFCQGEKVLGWALENFDENFPGKEDLERDIVKTAVFLAFKEAKKKAFLSDIPRSAKKLIEKGKYKAFFCFSPLEAKERVVNLELERKGKERTITAKEEENIQEKAIALLKEKLFSGAYPGLDFLNQDFDWLSFVILSQKIEGYQVPCLKGYKGGRLDFEILASFIFKPYLKFVKQLAREMGIKEFEIKSFAKSLAFSGSLEANNSAFIDFGGKATAIVLIENGQIKGAGEILTGGEEFTQKISEALGLDKASARILKEKYCSGRMEDESREKIKKMLSLELKKWYNALMEKAEEIGKKNLSFYSLFISGGGAYLPELKGFLEKRHEDKKIEIIIPEEINSPQFSFLIKYA